MPRRVVLALVALLASGCPRTPSPATDGASDDASVPNDAATDASNATAEDAAIEAAVPIAVPVLGWIHPARYVSAPDITATSREAFLAAHGVAADKPDAACWSSGIPVCDCARTLAVTTPAGTSDLLVCTRPVEPPSAALLLGMGRRSILYAVHNGVMSPVLDVPTRATFDPENGEGHLVGSVSLRVVASPSGISLVDEYETDEGPWCPQAVKRAAAKKGKDWPFVQRAYAAVCAAAGRYVLARGRLVRGG